MAGDFNSRRQNKSIAITDFFNGTVLVLLGNGNGTFRNPAAFLAGVNPQSVAVGDFNGDGNLDLAVADNALTAGFNDNTWGVTVLWGDGTGSFPTSTFYLLGDSAGFPVWVTAADFNGDNKTDLVCLIQGDNIAAVMMGNGNGTFAAASNFATGNLLASAAVGDFNGDGKLDLA